MSDQSLLQPTSVLAPTPPQTDVLLVTMPFGPLYQPSIGLSLLKGVLQKEEISVQILYLTIKFAEIIGPSLFNQISLGNPYVDLAGEWLFSDTLFEGKNERSKDFIDDVLRRKSPLNSRRVGVPEAYIKALLRVQTQIEPFLELAVNEVLSRKPKIVGITSTFQQHVPSLCFAKRLKEAQPNLFIVMGGGNCEGMMGYETIRQFPFVDAVVSGEGEIIFPQLVKKVLNRESVDVLQGVFTQKNIDFVNVGGKTLGAPPVYEMDALPIPNYDDYFEQVENSTMDASRASFRVLFETSRGCWWGERNHCTFCGLNGETMTYRSKSADRAIEELVFLTSRYRNLSVWVVDNILDMKYFQDFIPKLIDLRLDLDLFYEVKANLKKEQLEMMRQAGIRNLQPGIESLNDHVLKLMKKGVSWLQNVQLLKWGKELDVEIFWNVLWGFPEETPEDYAQMTAVLPLLAHMNPPTGSAKIRLDRFSPHFNEAESYGFVNMRPAIPYTYMYPFPKEVLGNLAYHFFYDYEDGRDIREYTMPLSDQINIWRENHGKSDLFMVDLEDCLLIWDFRDTFQSSLTVLRGLERLLYLECDEIQNKRRLTQFAQKHDPAVTDIESLLAPLAESGLLLQDGNLYLSLAVQLGKYKPSLIVMQKLRDVAPKTNILLDDEEVEDMYEFPVLDNRFFALNSENQAVIHHHALAECIDYLVIQQLTGGIFETIGGITVDM